MNLYEAMGVAVEAMNASAFRERQSMTTLEAAREVLVRDAATAAVEQVDKLLEGYRRLLKNYEEAAGVLSDERSKPVAREGRVQ